MTKKEWEDFKKKKRFYGNSLILNPDSFIYRKVSNQRHNKYIFSRPGRYCYSANM